jgi:TonB family protein
MRRETAFTLVAFSAAILAAAQQPSPAVSPQTTLAPITLPLIYELGSDVTAPQLLPGEYVIDVPRGCVKVDAIVPIGLVVDALGNPQNIHLLSPMSADLEKLATSVVSADRFKPGLRNGTPVNVAVEDEVTLSACDKAQNKQDSGNDAPLLTLRSAPKQMLEPIATTLHPVQYHSMELQEENTPPGVFKIGGRVTAPKVIHSVNAQFTDEARRANYQGVCLIGLIVDAKGIPQNIHVVRPLGMGLDEKAIEAVKQYRFKPAFEDGKTPVPVMITIEVDFRLGGPPLHF